MKRRAGIGTLGRAPVPEWEELVRAAWPGRVPSRLAAAAARAYLVTLLVGMALLVVAAWGGWPWLGLLSWVAVSLVEWLATAADTPAGRLLHLVGLRPQTRALLRSMPAAGLVFGLGSTAIALAYITVVLVIQLAWVAQPVLATWVSRSSPPLRYLPGAVRQPEPLRAHARAYAPAVGTPGAAVGLEFVALTAALAAGSGVFPAAWGLWLTALVAALALAALGATALGAVRLRRAQPAWQATLLAELASPEPSFLVYVSLAARQSKYIVNQWLPALDALAPNGILLVREASQLSPLGSTRQPVVYGAGPKDVERLTLPSVRAAFYLAYGERNGQLLRDTRLKHVMLLHGDSDKATSANGMARAFDEIWVAGPAAVERYRTAGVDLPDSRFVLIGRPQVAGCRWDRPDSNRRSCSMRRRSRDTTTRPHTARSTPWGSTWSRRCWRTGGSAFGFGRIRPAA